MTSVIVSGMAQSLTTGTKSADLVSGTYQFIGRSKITLIAKGSATGMTVTLLVGGIAVVNDQPIPFFGTTGTMSVNDNIVCSQLVQGGKVELYLRNPTGGTLTADFTLLFDPQ